MRWLLAAMVATVARAGCDSTDKSFDYLSLVMQWPPASGHNITQHFTLHGLWPSRVGSRENTYPCQCNDEQFDESKLSSIMNDMQAYWPSFGSTNERFWEHEWQKHGTCAEQLAPLASQVEYFGSALKMLKEAGLISVFAKAGITPSDSKPYKAADMIAAAKSVLGGTVSLGCKKSGGTQYLADVALCHDKSLRVVDCDSSVVAPDNDPCDFSDPILFGQSSGPAPAPGPSPSNVCVAGHHGPKCQKDADCTSHPGCIRCAKSGFCTSEPKSVRLLVV